MIVNEVLAIAGTGVKIKCGAQCIEHVTTNNNLIAPFVFTSEVKCITVTEDHYGNYVLELKIKE